jgi:hypothetical protein
MFAGFAAAGNSVDPFIVEEKGKLQHFYLSLPLSRKSIVNGRYAFMLLYVFGLMILVLGITMLTAPTIKFLNFSIDMKPSVYIMLSAVGFALSSVFIAISYPILFRVGYEKGKIPGFWIPMIVLMIPMFILTGYISRSPENMNSLLTKLVENSEGMVTSVTLISIGVGVLFYTVSYFLSQKLFAGRNL